ncbi:ATPase, T2SS/T4P/T4SS family [Vibrio owensii]|uniref:ATPase, T2SS/T4P/T4SS family n=1 Tax=Vibrio harveyi group TaxID=717610 RepID=UPI003CC511D1
MDPKLTDIYIPTKTPAEAFYYPNLKPAYTDLKPFIDYALEVNGRVKKKDFAIESQEGVRFRCHRMPSNWGDMLILRRIPDVAWDLDACGFNEAMKSHLLSDRHLKGGLFIVCGMPGNGKSTTCGGIVIDRLKEFGGHCNTIEDPIEMPLMGRHGNGFCIQREVDAEEDFHGAVRDTMRGYPTGVPTTMLIGEVRDPSTAELALRSSIDGRLVIVSFHASSVIQGIQRMASLASDSLGTSEARDLLASSFRLALHQKLIGGKLCVNSLLDTQEVIGTIRSEKVPFEQLSSEVMRQKKLMSLGQEIDVRP